MYTNVGCWYMYQFVEDLKESQYKKFVQEKKLNQKRNTNKDCFYIGFAKDKKLIACARIFILIENQKRILYIPLGIQTIIEDSDFYLFVKKYLIITAKKYHAQIIKVYSQENENLLEIGFKLTKKSGDSYLPLKKEKAYSIILIYIICYFSSTFLVNLISFISNIFNFWISHRIKLI